MQITRHWPISKAVVLETGNKVGHGKSGAIIPEQEIVWLTAYADRDRSVTVPQAHPKMQGQWGDSRSHDEAWPERREASMQRFAQRVIAFVEPHGYAAPWEGADSTMSREDEIAALIATQEQEIAPEFARLAANGVEAMSMDADYLNEDGEPQPMAEAIAEYKLVTDITAQLDSRQEQFLRAADEQRWYSGRPRVAYAVANDEGKRGLVPKAGHPWTREELKQRIDSLPSAQEIRVAMKNRSLPKDKRQHPYSPVDIAKAEWEAKYIAPYFEGIEARAEEGEVEFQMSRLPAETYAPNEECEVCYKGIVQNEAGEEEACWTCQGTGSVIHTIGFDGVPAI